MSKLTKQQIKEHEEALALLRKDNLTEDEILTVYEKYHEGAEHINSRAGAFFTPFMLARDLALHVPDCGSRPVRVIDLCAGIGVLSFAALMSGGGSKYMPEITCVEINPDYVRVGRKLVPQANWICADVLDRDVISTLGRFDYAISNPPFGNIKSPHSKGYTGNQFEYMVIEAASHIADGGAFIIPQMSAPFIYSGSQNSHWRDDSCRAAVFERKSGIKMDFNIGVDTSQYKENWHGVSPTCEIVCCEFDNAAADVARAA